MDLIFQVENKLRESTCDLFLRKAKDMIVRFECKSSKKVDKKAA